MTEEKAVSVEEIILDERCQARVAIDQATVDAYQDLIEDGIDLGPLDVWEVDGVKLLTDGWLRLEAYKQLGKSWFRVRIVGRSSEIEDATLAALKAHTPGLRRSRADNRRCVRLALEAGLYEDLGSDPDMAQDLDVSEALVANVRADVEDSDQVDDVSTATAEVQPERKPKKAKPSPFEAFRKNVKHVGRDVPKFYEHGSQVHEAAQRFVKLVRETDVTEVA